MVRALFSKSLLVATVQANSSSLKAMSLAIAASSSASRVGETFGCFAYQARNSASCTSLMAAMSLRTKPSSKPWVFFSTLLMLFTTLA
ncbi:hypothetical protein D3C72_1545550 [compost metagenome]